MLDTLSGLANVEIEPDVPDSDLESDDADVSESSFDLPSIDQGQQDENANVLSGIEEDFEVQEDVIPGTFINQSQSLTQSLNECRSRYREIDEDCVLGCGSKRGNLILIQCGHSDYCCIECIIQHSTVNHSNAPRCVNKCPEDNCQIESFTTFLLGIN